MITVDFNRLAIRPGDRVLDLGCGGGRHTAAACRPPRAFAVGADVSLAELGDAKNRLRLHDRLGECGGRWGLCAADTTRLPFARKTFDLVICCEVLEHIRDHRRAAAEIARVLRPGGQLVVSVPRCWPEKVCWALSRAYHLAEGGHVRIYRRAALAALLEAAGLRLRAAHWAHSLHTPYWWLKCLVGPQRNDHPLVNLYQRFLTWDIMRRPRITGFCDRLLNPLLGKSLVLYFRKN
ncbi:MAG: methyltransferase domain-containing protein [Desulfobacterales bacterium]